VPGMGVIAAVVCLVRRQELPLRILGASFAGPLAATLLHPYFPNNVSLAWDQLVNVASSVWGIRREIPADLFGPELTAASTADLLAVFPAWLPLAVGLLMLISLRPARELSTAGVTLVWIAGLMMGFAFLSQRFFGFFVPVAILAGGRVCSEFLGEAPLAETRRAHPLAYGSFALLFAVTLLIGQVRGHVGTVRDFVTGYLSPGDVQPAVDFLRAEAAPGELVYHNFWWDFSTLYHFRPDGRYVEALDPVFFYEYDELLFKKSLRAFRGQSTDLHRRLVEDFDAYWVFVALEPKFRPFRRLLREDARFELVFEDAHSQVYRISR